MENGYFKRVQKKTPTKFWINNVTREEAILSIDAGAVGCTQNPSYTWKMLQKENPMYVDGLLKPILKQTDDDSEALTLLQRALVKEIAECFMPLYTASHGKEGYVSIQGDPFRESTETIIRTARLNREASPNIMVKIPAVPEGIEAIRILASEGVPINATECMAARQVVDVCEAYVDATCDMERPAPLYFSLITGIYDEYLHKQVQNEKIDIDQDALWQAGITVAKKVYELVRQRSYPCGFISGGARGMHHFTEMVGAEACVTINWKGMADELLARDLPVVQRFHAATPHSVIDELSEKLVDFRRAYYINSISPEEYDDFGPVKLFRSSFEDAWTNALEYIANARREQK